MASRQNMPLDQFYEDVKVLEKRDSILTSVEQLNRLNRPGSKYFNLNPYDVLMLDPETPETEIKRKYKQLTILVHPDKNREDPVRSKVAFEAVQYAFKTLNSSEGRTKCNEILEESRAIVFRLVEDKRAKLRKQGARTLDIEEDDPFKYKRQVHIQMCKFFADLEKLRVEEDKKKVNERKRKLEKDDEEKDKREQEKEYQKNYDNSMDKRVSNYRDFVKKPKRGNKYRPAQTPIEQRLKNRSTSAENQNCCKNSFNDFI